MKTYVLVLIEAAHRDASMSTHNVCFCRDIRKIGFGVLHLSCAILYKLFTFSGEQVDNV